jgi:hypothetical protein
MGGEFQQQQNIRIKLQCIWFDELCFCCVWQKNNEIGDIIKRCEVWFLGVSVNVYIYIW